MNRAPLLLSACLVFGSLVACGDKSSSEGSASAKSEANPAKSAKATASSPPSAVSSSAATTASGSSGAPEAPAAAPAYTSTEGRFEVKFPTGNPIESTKADPNGVDWHDVSADTPTGKYAVQWSDFVNSGEAEGTVMVFMPTREKEKIKVDKKIKVGAYEGRDMEVALNPTLTMWLRFVIVGRRVYKIVAGNKGRPEEASAFIESFKVTGDGAGAAPSAAPASGSAAPADVKGPVGAPSKGPRSAPAKPAKPPTPPRADDL